MEFLKTKTRVFWTKRGDQYISRKFLAGDRIVHSIIDTVTGTIGIYTVDPHSLIWKEEQSTNSIFKMKNKAKKALELAGVKFFQEKRVRDKE